ncbi:universal stress protein [Lacinutrix iliipiscaria]|uniref:Universal stress protein n=1 Tax=Lacinutrix iliipiscaria TaxID=1230532 RepID=A0ABW5WNY1_9FLAO
MKNILLLTDFSKNALNAIQYAMHFFASETCTFHIMYVHKIGSFTSDDLMRSPKESIYESITKEPKEKLNKLIDDLKEEFNNSKHTFDSIIDFDTFIDAVKQASKNKAIDYIVMGTNGATGAKEVLLGSNTVNVIRKVNCKTIIVPEGYTFKPIQEILLPLDPDDTIKGNVYTDLLEFIETYQLHLHVLRVNPNSENQENLLNDKSNLSIIDCKYHVVNDVPIDFAVSSYLQTHAIDFMVLFIQKEGFLEHLFSKSNTRIKVSKINKPILILHA